jgi:hypothetical protein
LLLRSFLKFTDIFDQGSPVTQNESLYKYRGICTVKITKSSSSLSMLMFLAITTAAALMAIPAVAVDYLQCEAAAAPFSLKGFAEAILPLRGRVMASGGRIACT